MINIRFYIQERSLKPKNEVTENFRLIMSVTFSGSRIIYYPGINLRKVEWDKEKQEFSSFRSNAFSLNAYLRKLDSNAKNIIKSLQYKDGLVKPVFFRQQLNRLKITPGLDLFDAYLHFMEKNVENWSKGSYLKCKSLFRHLTSFREVYPSRIVLENCDEAFFNELVTYFQGKKLNYYTINAYVNVFKWFLNWCLKEEYMINSSFKTYRIPINESAPSQKIAKCYLCRDELMRYLDFEFPQRQMAQVRDIFCFLAFSKLKFSEVKNLKREDVFQENIQITGRSKRSLDHNEFTLLIRDRYKNTYYKDNWIFPHFSIITVNKYLRLGLKLAGINREILRNKEGENYIEHLNDRISVANASDCFK